MKRILMVLTVSCTYSLLRKWWLERKKWFHCLFNKIRLLRKCTALTCPNPNQDLTEILYRIVLKRSFMLWDNSNTLRRLILYNLFTTLIFFLWHLTFLSDPKYWDFLKVTLGLGRIKSEYSADAFCRFAQKLLRSYYL